jgi:hypothetical protein
MVMHRIPVYLIFTLWLVAPILTVGQTGTSMLRGTVTDSQGAKIPGAIVTARNIATGAERSATSGEDGNYTVPVLPPGLYSVTGEAPNFRKQTAEGIELQIGLVTTLNFKLDAGTVPETVTITGETTLETSTASVGTTYNAQQIRELPSAGRDPYELARLTPGIFSTSSTGASRSGDTVAAAGINRGIFSIDGVNVTSSQNLGTGARISADSIEQFRVETGVLPAEFGRGGGSAASVIGKSGSNEYHGSASFELRDDKLQARGPFGGPVKPSYNFQRFGGTIGGKILRDRLFFFFSLEHIRDNGATTVGRRDLNTRLIVPGFAPTPSRSTLLTARVDANLANEDRLFGQYRLQRSSGTNPGFSHDGKLQDPTNFEAQEDREDQVGGGWTHLFTNTIVNQLRFGIYSNEGKSRPLTTEPQIVFPSINVGANYLADRHRIENIAQLRNDITWVRKNHTFQFGVNYRHISLPEQNFNLFGQGIIVVPCDFSGQPGCPTAMTDSQIPVTLAFVNRQVSNGSFQGFGQLGPIPSIDNDTFDTYAQDTWRVTSKLILNFGLRWEYDRDFAGKNQTNKTNPRKRKQKKNAPDPRVSIVWVLKIPIRAGAGWFHQTNFMTTRQLELLADGVRLPIVRASNTTLGSPFLNVLPNAPPDIFVTSNTLRQPRVRQIVFGADFISGENFPKSPYSLSATFISNRGHSFPRLIEINRQPDGTRLNSDFDGVRETQSISNTAYDGLEVSFSRRQSKLYSLQASFSSSYVLSRSLEEDNDALGYITTVSDPTRPQIDRGPAPYDSRHSFNFWGTIELPRPTRLIFAPVIRAYSSRPVEIIQNHDFSEGVGSNAVRLPGLGANAGNRQVRTGGDINRLIDLFNANAALVTAHGGPIADVNPKINLSHPYLRIDLSVYRSFNLKKENLRLEVRADAYNVLNRVNITGIRSENQSGLQNNVESPNFGRPFGITPGGVFGTNSARAFALSAKFIF